MTCDFKSGPHRERAGEEDGIGGFLDRWIDGEHWRRSSTALPGDRFDLVGIGMGYFFIFLFFYWVVWGSLGLKPNGEV